MKKAKKPVQSVQANFVAKHAHQFNKAHSFRDKTQYRRKVKHQGREPLAIPSFDVIAKGFRIASSRVMGYAQRIAATGFPIFPHIECNPHIECKEWQKAKSSDALY